MLKVFRLGRFQAPQWAIVAGVTLLTLALTGGVVLVSTPAGCGVAHRVGIRVNEARCGVASKGQLPQLTPSPESTYKGGQTPSAGPTGAPTASASVPPVPTPNNPSYPPYEYAASEAFPPIVSAPMPGGSGFSCRLPIYAGPPGSGGFLVFPGGTFVGDPRSAVAPPTPSAGAPPAQGTQLGLTYDAGAGHWLPVQRSWVTPDASHYAWPGSDGIYVADVATGTVSQIGLGHTWTLIALDGSGVYVSLPNVGGLWLIPLSGAAKQLSAGGYWQAVGGGAAYGTDLSQVPFGTLDSLRRLDLKTGTSTLWFESDDASVPQVIGFDLTGAPVISTTGGREPSTIWLAPRLGAASPLGSWYYYGGNQVSAIADSHGLWLGSPQGVYLYDPATGWSTPAVVGGNLAGVCS